MTLISIIIPAFNAQRYIEKAIRSALAQSFANIEVIVINDGSTDQTGKILEDLSREDDRIVTIDNDRNKGAAYSRNIGINAARGEWIALLDADDWWDHRRLAVLLDIAGKHSADIVADNIYLIDGDASKPWRTLFPRKNFSTISISVDDYLQNDMPGVFGTWGLLIPIFKKSFLNKNNVRYKEDMKAKHDSEFYMECFYNKPKFILCSDPFYYYRLHTNSISGRVKVSDLAKSQDVNQRFLSKFRDDGANSTCELLNRRIAGLNTYIRYRKVIEPIKRGDWIGGAKQALGDVGITGYVARMFLKLVGRKVQIKFAQIFPH